MFLLKWKMSLGRLNCEREVQDGWPCQCLGRSQKEHPGWWVPCICTDYHVQGSQGIAIMLPPIHAGISILGLGQKGDFHSCQKF